MSEGLTFAERGMVALGFVLSAAALAAAAWHIGLWYVARRWERDHNTSGGRKSEVGGRKTGLEQEHD